MEILKNRYLYIGIGFLLLIIFLAQNTTRVEVNFLFWNLIDISLFIIIFFSGLLGFILGLIFSRKIKKDKYPSDQGPKI